ncbi:uncharacterized protein LOC126262771 [Schistocerca nitens]|uniref:uncharacterized protein LOC126262771 n=1 Tax=Schistocerca nitens TaxID=7011 RepID=UPI00211936BD|nr:uncharacterized protein LOC126262771 [Schistocerca nitens]
MSSAQNLFHDIDGVIQNIKKELDTMQQNPQFTVPRTPTSQTDFAHDVTFPTAPRVPAGPAPPPQDIASHNQRTGHADIRPKVLPFSSPASVPLPRVSHFTFASDRGPPASRLQIRPPPFVPERPEIWFAIMENIFVQQQIVNDLEQFTLVICNLDQRASSVVSDIIMQPPPQQAYATLKTALISRCTKPVDQRISQLLYHEKRGDRSPSDFYRHLRAMVDPSVFSDTLLLHIWQQQLPPQVGLTLIAYEGRPLSELLQVADRAHSLFDSRATVAAAATTSANDTSRARPEPVDAAPPACAATTARRAPDATEDFRSLRAAIDQLTAQLQRLEPRDVAAADTHTRRRQPTRPPRHANNGTGWMFLVDTGSDVSTLPVNFFPSDKRTEETTLKAVNDSVIHTYGQKTLPVDIGLPEECNWTFVMADIDQPILGADFLAKHALSVDLHKSQLVHSVNGFVIPGIQGRPTSHACQRVDNLSAPTWEDTIATKEADRHTAQTTSKQLTTQQQAPAVSTTKATPKPQQGTRKSRAKHETVHHIRTTPGPPVSSRVRRLAPDRLRETKAIFNEMLQEGTIQPSNSPWSSPLHLAQLVYGEPLRVPAEFLAPVPLPDDTQLPHLLQQMRKQAETLRAAPTSQHGTHPVFIHKSLDTCSHIMLRTDLVSTALELANCGQILNWTISHLASKPSP